MKYRALAISASLFLLVSCSSRTKAPHSPELNRKEFSSDFQISLAQWSLHRSFLGPQKENYWQWFNKMISESPDSLLKGELKPIDFPQIAAGYGIYSIELVNIFYLGKAEDEKYWTSFKDNCEKAGVSVGLIMCDGLGNLSSSDSLAQQIAIQKHYKWVDIAEFLGAHSIRVNIGGGGSEEEVALYAVEGLRKLANYAASKEINILVENHGGYSSNAKWLAGVMKDVNLANVGTLPDFGNFCIQQGPEGCIQEYNRYKGIAELIPYAKGLSAKSYEFNDEGDEVTFDFYRIMRIVKNSGYKGSIGIEYEGDELSEDEGIKATMTLLKKAFDKL